MENLYEVLEVSKNASKEVIEKAYKTLAKKYHPDLQSPENKSESEAKMKKINEAYEILSDEQKRKEYDVKLESEENIGNLNNNSGNVNYNNTTYKQNYNRSTNSNNQYYNKNYSQTYKSEYDSQDFEYNSWQQNFLKLSKKEQKKLKKRIEKEANDEYRRMYADYLRSLGYRVRYKKTFKDYAVSALTIIILITILIIILLILWWIPSTHEWMVNLYKDNFIVKLLVDIISNIFKSIISILKK